MLFNWMFNRMIGASIGIFLYFSCRSKTMDIYNIINSSQPKHLSIALTLYRLFCLDIRV